MITGIFTIVGVILGFYLAKFKEVNLTISKAVKKLEIDEPFVVATDEYKLEKEQKAEQIEPEILNVKDFLK